MSGSPQNSGRNGHNTRSRDNTVPPVQEVEKATSDIPTVSEEFDEIVKAAQAEAAVSKDDPEKGQRERGSSLSEIRTRTGSDIAYVRNVHAIADRKVNSLKDAIVKAVGKEVSRLEHADTAIRTRVQGVEETMAEVRESLPKAGTEATLATEVRKLRMDVNTLLERCKEAGSADPIEDIEERFRRVGSRFDRIETNQNTLEDQLAEVVRLLKIQSEDAEDRKPPEPSARGTSEKRSSRRKSSRRSRKSRKHRHRRHGGGSDPSSSSSDSEESSSSDSESSRGSRSRSSRHSDRTGYSTHFADRPQGQRFSGLRTIRPTNRDYRKLLDYRYYRLRTGPGVETPQALDQVKDCIGRIRLGHEDLIFDGSDGIRVLDFLARFVRSAEISGTTEHQAFLALPYFLKGVAHEQFRALEGASHRDGGVGCWPEAV